MSVPRAKFEAAAVKENWQEAFLNLNALSMTEMLDSLSKLPAAILDKLILRRFAFKVGVGMPRMEYAWTVVKTRALPLIAPGDLMQTGQVTVAGNFLGKAPAGSPAFKLNFIAFTDVIVSNRTLLGELQQKAEQILAAQGGGFKLNAVIHSKDIHLQEVVFQIPQLEEMIQLAEKETTIPKNHVIVLLVKVKSNINVHGIAPTIGGRRVVVIDTDSPNPDRATLLHEIGHCAGLPHAGEAPAGKASPVDVGGGDNVMAETKSNVPRDTLTVTQGDFLSKAFFASK